LVKAQHEQELPKQVDAVAVLHEEPCDDGHDPNQHAWIDPVGQDTAFTVAVKSTTKNICITHVHNVNINNCILTQRTMTAAVNALHCSVRFWSSRLTKFGEVNFPQSEPATQAKSAGSGGEKRALLGKVRASTRRDCFSLVVRIQCQGAEFQTCCVAPFRRVTH
jgi:hypothetical protein